LASPYSHINPLTAVRVWLYFVDFRDNISRHPTGTSFVRDDLSEIQEGELGNG